MKAWHFVSDTLRDGRPVPADGEVLVHKGPLILCASGSARIQEHFRRIALRTGKHHLPRGSGR
jgi:hypothetical protein